MRVAERSCFAGRSLAEIELRKKYGVTVLAIRRDSQDISNPNVTLPLRANDILIVLGAPDRVAKVAGLSQNPREGDAT